jgi:hypothetical protein
LKIHINTDEAAVNKIIIYHPNRLQYILDAYNTAMDLKMTMTTDDVIQVVQRRQHDSDKSLLIRLVFGDYFHNPTCWTKASLKTTSRPFRAMSCTRASVQSQVSSISCKAATSHWAMLLSFPRFRFIEN